MNQNKYFLEEYDYIPFIDVKFCLGTRSMHNFVSDKEFMIICINDISLITDRNLLSYFINKYNLFIVFRNNEPIDTIKSFSTKQKVMIDMFKIEDESINIYFANPNRRIYDIKNINDIQDIKSLTSSIIIQPKTITHIPYLLLENVLSESLLNEIVEYLNTNKKTAILHNSAGKNRFHVHPNKPLERKMDNKLSRSLFPEIRKVFYFDVKYRELYKICSYDHESNGRFDAHRDTPKPFQHRRYAMSLFLNDDYEGGEFELVEYGLKIKPKKNTAFVFPGICTHKVNTVTKGSRLTIITFYCSELEDKTKGNSMYTVKSNFYDENKVEFSSIFPI